MRAGKFGIERMLHTRVQVQHQRPAIGQPQQGVPARVGPPVVGVDAIERIVRDQVFGLHQPAPGIAQQPAFIGNADIEIGSVLRQMRLDLIGGDQAHEAEPARVGVPDAGRRPIANGAAAEMFVLAGDGRGLLELTQLFAVEGEAAGHAVGLRAGAAAQFQHVAEPLGGDQAGAAEVAFQHGVGGGGGAVDDQRHLRQRRHLAQHADSRRARGQPRQRLDPLHRNDRIGARRQRARRCGSPAGARA